MRRSFLLFSALLALVAGACSDGGEALGPTATVGTAPTTTARVIDVAVIPDDPADIDEAYVQAVVDALFAVDAQATKIFVETGEVDEEGVDILRSTFIDEELNHQLDNWAQTLARRPEEVLAGALRHSLIDIIGTGSDCVFFTTERDFSKTTTNEIEPSKTYLGITPKRQGDDVAGQNPTSWMIFSDSISADGSEPENPCAGR